MVYAIEIVAGFGRECDFVFCLDQAGGVRIGAVV